MKELAIVISLICNFIFFIWLCNLQGRLEWHRELLADLLNNAPDTATYTWIMKEVDKNDR